MVSSQVETLLDAFLQTARSPSSIEDLVLECGLEQWTYGDLDSISSGLALELHQQHGLRPTVAVLSENHPYTFALLLATWKLGGIFAPLDHNSPPDMIKQMAENIRPTCVLVPEDMVTAREIFSALGIRIISLPKNTTMTVLTQRYLDQSAFLSHNIYPPPAPSSLALYIHTSSASSIFNLKCVQLTHASIAKGSRSTVGWNRKTWPALDFSKLRILGWAPWSHIIGISHDIGGSVFGTGGCYVFGAAPSGYPTLLNDDPVSSAKQMDMVDRLLAAALRTQPDMMMTVPLVLEGFKKIYLAHLAANEVEKASLIKDMLLRLKGFGVGGASVNPDTFVWARDLGVRVTLNIGMTELGGKSVLFR
ncbi:hypothetical protein M413DRAFT_372837 [Hebeloma cylindrosporum]|uniref:AMP-dependent synthetase/ligase domain-containing protein n=1 Tax=Hebeloma cylindrosporum TaxID=76867 RepID=A0A0C3CIL5_HEBCY|nr:hypothetical protein M413DRAFT_372837 [Hebeloma cylindrosporum h7]